MHAAFLIQFPLQFTNASWLGKKPLFGMHGRVHTSMPVLGRRIGEGDNRPAPRLESRLDVLDSVDVGFRAAGNSVICSRGQAEHTHEMGGQSKHA